MAKTSAQQSVLSRLFYWWVRAYQICLSPLLGNRCRFYPSCSNYALEALGQHGALKGLLLSAYRIVRCNPLCKGGIDPVPPSCSKNPTNLSK